MKNRGERQEIHQLFSDVALETRFSMAFGFLFRVFFFCMFVVFFLRLPNPGPAFKILVSSYGSKLQRKKYQMVSCLALLSEYLFEPFFRVCCHYKLTFRCFLLAGKS